MAERLRGWGWLSVAVLLTASSAAAQDFVAGVAQRTFPEPSAAARRVDRRAELDATIWYPAIAGAHATEDVIGPPGAPYFDVGAMAQDAPPLPGHHPVVLLSHGFGGSAEIMGWLGAALARHGYVVISVDHPGNSYGDMSVVGAVAWWERPRDLISALGDFARDPRFGRVMDTAQVGAAGFSMGGTTALALGGAVVSPANYDTYCAGHAAAEVCQPPPEQASLPNVKIQQGIAMLGLTAEAAHAGEGTALPDLRAVLAISPNVQALDPTSLTRIHAPTVLVVGSADPVVPAADNAALAARAIPGAKLMLVPGAQHYTFLATCTPLGLTAAPSCKAAPEQTAAHAAAIDAALALFGRTLGR